MAKFWVTLARGTHPFPSRTRKLSLSAPIVLHARVCGRLGRRPVNLYENAQLETLGVFLFLVLIQPAQHICPLKVALFNKKNSENPPPRPFLSYTGPRACSFLYDE